LLLLLLLSLICWSRTWHITQFCEVQK